MVRYLMSLLGQAVLVLFRVSLLIFLVCTSPAIRRR